MSKKRRVFDIAMPDDLPAEVVAEPQGGKPRVTPESAPRRGPMASAVRENAESLQNRSSTEADIREENDRLAHEHVRLKRAGLITDLVPLDQILTTKLVRDRQPDRDDELGSLKESINAIGLSNPIQIEQIGQGEYQLIQGFRRLSAWRELLAESKDSERWGAIPATIIAQGEGLENLYRRMVDENLVRKDISFAEMAYLAISYADDESTDIDEMDAAVTALFKSAVKQKRTTIRAFAHVMREIGGVLQFPEMIPRRLGLALRAKLAAEPDKKMELVGELRHTILDRTVEDEMKILRQFVDGAASLEDREPQVTRVTAPRPAKTTFRLNRPNGAAKVVASHGRLEVRLDTDFSAKDRRRMETALAAFLEELGE